MAKIIRLTESDLNRLVRRIIKEAPTTTYEDTPESLRQYIKDTENRTVSLYDIKKDGDVYKVGFSKKYKYQNGRFTIVSSSIYNPENQQKRDTLDKLVISMQKFRGIQDESVKNSIKKFYYNIVDVKNVAEMWDNLRKKYKVEMYIPSWQEYQLMQNLA